MLEVVFNEGAKGSLKASKGYKKRNIINIKHKVASSLDVIQVGFRMDIGEIDGPVAGAKRKAVYQKLYGENNRGYSEADRFFTVLTKDFDLLKKRAKQGDTIRVWTSQSPYEACGFAYLCHYLRDFSCDIKVVELPSFRLGPDRTYTSYRSWNEVSTEIFTEFQSLERTVTDIEIRMQDHLWMDLRQEASDLRAIVNGQLMSVPEDFYDYLIDQYLPKEAIVMARLIGNIRNKANIAVDDGWYAIRIKEMIEKKFIQVIGVQDPDQPYGILIQRA